MTNLRLDCDFICKVPLPGLTDCYAAFDRNSHISIDGSHVHLTKPTLSNNSTVIFSNLVKFLLCVNIYLDTFQQLSTISVEISSQLSFLTLQ
ncbi:Os04g0220400 [Oryza sativa Japonica Group]|uniref:Os04g0220400 protein n=1 Tax=Oryza sativa subsp. japonica TaxID=39947 RepID=A0A0P0W7J1_ORYSJ|nr:Os04g0220400 [Oryza sativa Japonica Group]